MNVHFTSARLTAVGLIAGIIFLAGPGEYAGMPPEIQPAPQNLTLFLELARTDVSAEKAKLLAANIDIKDEEAIAFWPLYHQYDLELRRCNDRRLELMKAYSHHEKAYTDSKARILTEQIFTLEETRTDLKRKYFKKFSKVIGARKATRVFQIENQLGAAIELRAVAALPLIK